MSDREPTRPRGDRGFTLVEILIAIVLVGILSAVVVIGVGSLTGKGSDAACAASADAARTAAMTQVGGAPVTNLNTLVSAGAISLPAGTTVDGTGRAILGRTWTMWLTPGAPPTFTCTTGTGSALWTPALLPAGMALWFDAASPWTLTTNGTAVTTWGDRSGAGRDAANATAAAQPTLTQAAIGGLPGVVFDGSNDLLPFDGSFIAGTNYTVSAVVARSASKTYNAYLGGTAAVTNSDLVLGWRSDTTLMYAQFANDLDTTVPAFSTPAPELHVFRLDTSTGRQTWRNGTSLGTLGNTNALGGWAGASLGRYSGSFFAGTIGEVVITTTALSTTDRQKLEGYLAWKWGMQAQLPAGHPYQSAPPLAL